MNNSHIIPNSEALQFMTAGNATVTMVDLREEKRFTYKLMASDDNRFLWIKMLNGPDNQNNYVDIFVFTIKDGNPILQFTRRSHRVSETSPGVEMFKKVFMNLLIEREMQWLEVWHTGRCCRCGRLLTVPESIAQGIGPECILKENAFII